MPALIFLQCLGAPSEGGSDTSLVLRYEKVYIYSSTSSYKYLCNEKSEFYIRGVQYVGTHYDDTLSIT